MPDNPYLLLCKLSNPSLADLTGVHLTTEEEDAAPESQVAHEVEEKLVNAAIH